MKQQNTIPLLWTIVGSKAHGLASPSSDTDYRGVFIVPTIEFFKIGGDDIQHTSWIESQEDNTSWEVGKFLFMATKCNPTVLEVFLAPMIVRTSDIDPNGRLNVLATELRELFPFVWNTNDVYHAFVGYGINQRKKFFEDKDKRAPKYATAYLRVLYNACELLETGAFLVDMTNTPVFETLKRFKAGNFTKEKSFKPATSNRRP